MHSDIRRLATNLDVKLHGLQQIFSGSNEQSQIDGVKHLKEFVQSAATVLSSTSTVLSADEDPAEEHSEDGDDFRSDFGDWFKAEVNVSTLDWIYSTNGSTSIFDLGQTRTSLQPLAENSPLQRNPRPSSLSRTPAANQLSQVALSNLNLSNSKDIQLSVSLSRVRDETKEKERPTSNAAPALPSSPSYGQTKSPESSLSLASSPREKRHSLARLFSRQSPPNDKPEEEPKPKKPPLFRRQQGGAELRRKFVFVGDGACGKTCFLM
jgi:hypothetical protein